MRLIESYIFTRMLRTFVLTLVVLAATVWLSQALREFDLVSAMGQTIVTFLQITLLLLPALATVVSPVAILIGVVYTFRTLNDGSELVVINAAGTPQSAVLKPVILVGLIGAIVMSSMTLYFAPLSLRIWRTLITDVRGNIITTILREGEFMSLAPGLTFHLRRRAPDGSLQGIFMSDSRDPETTVTYLAERGAVLDNPLGVFMVMNNGTIQKTSKKDKSNSIIEFTSYAYDLSSFAAQSSSPPFRPQERSTAYLIHPDPNDRFFQQFPGKFRSELHYRLTAPFNAILFAILPLVFLGQAETTRQQRSATIGIAVSSAVGFGALQFVLTSAAEDHFLAVLGLYAVPLTTIAVGAGLVLAGKQPRPPESLLALGDIFTHGVRRLFRGRGTSRGAGRLTRAMLTIGWTLAFYFARRFAFMVLAIFMFFVLLIGGITYLEYLTRSIRADEFDAMQVLLLTAYRVPSICEDVLPFTTLFGSIAAFVIANRRLEVVVARAAGISAWQFLLPACVVGLLFGVISTTLYNPASTIMRGWADELQAKLLSSGGPGEDTEASGPVWLRQAAEGRELIIGAQQSFEHGLALARVTAFIFEENGRFRERVDAPTAHFSDGEWRLEKATITAPSRVPKSVKIYHLPTELTPGQVRQTFDNLDAVSFWELPKLIEASNRARVSATRYELRYYRLLSRPIVLLSMVLLAAIVSLRFSRSRDVGNMILAGVGAGFMLYVVSKIATDLGSGGIVPPPLAAWLPAIVTLLVGSTVLLHLEDG